VTTVLALGDSFSCGEGVGVNVALERTWTSLLATALPGGRAVHLARPGARVRDVRDRQLPLATDQVGALATLLVGLNDVARLGFVPERVREDLLATVAQLRHQRRVVLLARLHDPTTLLALPARVCSFTRSRVAQVNAAVDEAAAGPGVLVLDLASVATLGDPAGRAVDRIHPSPAGHAAIAAAAAAVLRRAGWSVGDLPLPDLPAPPSRAQLARWLVLHAVPYLTQQLPDCGRPALAALARRA
jgi:lysophospholipase L1-like esterase